jgi:hypothetical protein
VGEVEKLLLSINNDKPPGIDNLDGKLLRMVADSLATPICHIFSLSLEESLCPQAWREAKVKPLPKSGKVAFTGMVENCKIIKWLFYATEYRILITIVCVFY